MHSTTIRSLSMVLVGALAAGAMAAEEIAPRRARRARVTPVYKEYKAIEVRDGGSIEGVVLYKAPPPAPEKIAIVKDQETCKTHPVERPLIEVNDKHQVRNAVVFLNIKAGKAPERKDDKSTIDQKGCEFTPHVQVVQLNQPVEIVNSDPVAHNIQATQSLRTLFNHLQPQQGMKQEEKFTQPGLVSLQCQAHTWMKAFRYVLPHPYHAVTGEDGSFKISDIPPGEYELHVWQEHVGEQMQKVKVEAGKPTKIEFELAPKG
jgi:plastocyanin